MRSVHCTSALVVCVYSADEVVKSARQPHPHFESDFSLLYVLKQSLFTKIKKGLQHATQIPKVFAIYVLATTKRETFLECIMSDSSSSLFTNTLILP